MNLHSINIPNKKAIIDHQGQLIEVEWEDINETGKAWLTSKSSGTLMNDGIQPGEVGDLIRSHLASAPKHEWVEGMDNVSIEEVIATSYALDAGAETSQKQPRYTNEQGFDLIDEWAETYPIETFRVLMWEQMRKYHRRLGKKDSHASEVAKIADYARRWVEVENRLIAQSPH